MLSKIKTALALIGIKSNYNSHTPIIKTVQEDSKTIEAVKRVGNYLEKNHQLLVDRGMIPHSSQCNGDIDCKKENCFKIEPDRIVGQSFTVEIKKRN